MIPCIVVDAYSVHSPFGLSCERKIVGPADPRKDKIQSW